MSKPRSGKNVSRPGVSTGKLHWMYRTMVRIRRLEEKIGELVSGGEIVCPCHLYIGQEAIAAGVCANLRKEDMVFSTHRSHGHYVAKGGDVNTLMAELYGKAGGCSRGRGGSMHLAAPEIGFPGSSAIVGGTIPISVGAALAFAINKKRNVSVAFFGDGALGEGVFYESLNFASLKKLPVVFICENNYYSTHMTLKASLADTDIYHKAGLFDMPGFRIDGNDSLEVLAAAGKAVIRARHGHGPTLIECETYRWRGHVGPNYDLDKGLRTQDELDRWMKCCPIKSLERWLLKNSIMDITEIKRIRDETEREIAEAVNFAKDSPYPEPDELTNYLFKS